MPLVYIPALLQPLTDGQSSVEVAGGTVGEVIDSLDRRWPGMKERLLEGERLRPNICVAVDGEVSPTGLLEKVDGESEVHFVAAIKGGSDRRTGSARNFIQRSPKKWLYIFT